MEIWSIWHLFCTYKKQEKNLFISFPYIKANLKRLAFVLIDRFKSKPFHFTRTVLYSLPTLLF